MTDITIKNYRIIVDDKKRVTAYVDGCPINLFVSPHNVLRELAQAYAELFFNHNPSKPVNERPTGRTEVPAWDANS